LRSKSSHLGRRGAVKAQAIQLYQGWIKHVIFTHIWMPSVCAQQFTSFKQSSSKMGPKSMPWENLGLSPMHAHNVHLVLSLTTGLVSPQFHVRFDDFFETCKYGVTDGGLASTWQMPSQIQVRKQQ
jgi:hypothetical protein